LHPLSDTTADGLAALWYTALTGLSVEIEGHSLGGGMLKLEPNEAQNVILARTHLDGGELRCLARELDGLVRAGRAELAQERADQIFLCEGLGLSERDCKLLRRAAHTLRDRRYSRNRRA
jgi:hypothetical protein